MSDVGIEFLLLLLLLLLFRTKIGILAGAAVRVGKDKAFGVP